MSLTTPTLKASLASSSNASSYATNADGVAGGGTFTVANGKLGLALVIAETAQADGNPPQPTFDACGETWDVVEGADFLHDAAGGTRQRMTLFRIMDTGLTTTTGVADFGSAPIIGCKIIVLEAAGSILTGAKGANAIRQVAVNAGHGTDVDATLEDVPLATDGTLMFVASNGVNTAVSAAGAESVLKSVNHSGPNANGAALWVAPDGAQSMGATLTGTADWGAIIIELVEQDAAPTPPSTDWERIGFLYDTNNSATYQVPDVPVDDDSLVLAIVHVLQAPSAAGDPVVPQLVVGANAFAAQRITDAENLYDGAGGTRGRVSMFWGRGVPGTHDFDITLGGTVHVGCQVEILQLAEGEFDPDDPIRQAAVIGSGDELASAGEIEADSQLATNDRAVIALVRNQGNDAVTDDGTFIRSFGGSFSGPLSALDVLIADATAPQAGSAIWGAAASWGMTYVEIRALDAIEPTDPGGDGIPTPELVAFIDSNQDLTQYDTTSWTPEPNSVLIAHVTNEQSSGVGNADEPAVTGHGLTWDLLETNAYDTDGGTRGHQSAWRTKVGGSPGSDFVRATFSPAQIGCSVHVYEIADSGDLDSGGTRGANAVRNSVKADAIGAKTILASLDEPLWTLNSVLALVVHQANEVITPGGGYTLIGQGGHPGPVSHTDEMYAPPGGPQSGSASWGSSTTAGLILLELMDVNAEAPTSGGTTTGHPWIDIVEYSTSRRIHPSAPWQSEYTGQLQDETEGFTPATDALEQLVGRGFNGQRLYNSVGSRYPVPKDLPGGGNIGGHTPGGGTPPYKTGSDLDALSSTGPPPVGTGPHIIGDPGNLYEQGHRCAYISIHCDNGSSFSWDDIVDDTPRRTQHATLETPEAYFKWIGGLFLSETMGRYRFHFGWHHEPENEGMQGAVPEKPVNLLGGVTALNSRENWAASFIKVIDWWAEIGLVPRKVDPDSPLLTLGGSILSGTWNGGQHGPIEAWFTPALVAKLDWVGASLYSRWKTNTRAKQLMDPVHNGALAMTGPPWNLVSPPKVAFGEFGCAERFVEATTIAQQPRTWDEVAALTPTAFKATFWAELAATLKSAAYNNNCVDGEPDVEFISITDHWAMFKAESSPQLYPITSSIGSLNAFKAFVNDPTSIDGTHTIFGKPLTFPEVDAWTGDTNPPEPAPVVTGFTPISGPVGTLVKVSGTDFTGATVVEFNGTPTTSFVVIDGNTIQANVPAGATTGPITVTTPGGSDASTGSFTVAVAPPVNPPTVSSFTPTEGPAGTVIAVTGTNFTGATAVRIGGVLAPGFVVNSPTQISVTVPGAAVDGQITVTTSAGTGTSAASFDVTATTGGGGDGDEVGSIDNPIGTATIEVAAIWLVDGDYALPGETTDMVRLIDTRDLPSEIGELSGVLEAVGGRRPQRVTDAIRGYEGSVEGVVESREEIDILNRWKAEPGKRIRLVASDMNIPVQLGRISIGRFPFKRFIYNVAIEAEQIDEYSIVGV